MRWSTVGAALSGLVSMATAIDPIEVSGNKFFNKDGSQFFIKGVAYQLRPDDPLTDTEQCKRDAALMKDLGTNTIRIYHVDPTANHDGCMKAFADVGIYTLIDLDTFTTYILPADLYWNQTQHDHYAQVMDTFHDYNNVLGFFIGNENIAKKEDSPAAPYLKAAARDMKAYRDRKGYRQIPIGYSAADIAQLRPMLQDYLTCGGNSSEIIDFFALNSYSWCDPSTYTTSSYDKLQQYAAKFPVPIFFSETGCNVPGPRTWDDMDAIFGPDMVGDWSGVIVYEWIQEQNNYGIISYGPQTNDLTRNDDVVFDGFTRKGTPTPKSPDFQNLQTKWQKIKPTGVSKAAHDPKDVSTRACPASTEGGWWRVDGNVALPSMGQTYTGGSLPSATATATATTTAAANPTGSSKAASSTNKKDEGNAASGDKNIAAASAALVGVMLIFTVWL